MYDIGNLFEDIRADDEELKAAHKELWNILRPGSDPFTM
jgi:hypothetical protein